MAEHGGGGSIGDFFVSLFFKTDEHSKKEAEEAIDGIREKFAELAKEAFAFNEIKEAIESILEPIHQLWEGVEKVAETGHHLETLGETLGITVEQIQKFGFYAQSAGVSAETMQHSLFILSRQMGEAATGESKELSAAFQKIGVDVRGADGAIRNVGEVMPELLEKFSKLESPAERASLAMKVFGRGGIELLPLLSQESEKLQQLNEDFEALGGAFSEELLERSHDFITSTNKATFAFENMKREISTGILPAFTGFVEVWLDFARTSWPELSHTLKSIGETLGDVFMKTAGTAFDSFLKTIRMVLKDAELLNTIKTIVLGVGAAFAGWLAWTNPVAAGLLLVTAAVEDVLGAIQGKDSIIGRITVAFHDWWNELKRTHEWLGKVEEILHKLKLGVDVADKFFSSPEKTLQQSIDEVAEEEKNRGPGFFERLDTRQRTIDAIKASSMADDQKNLALQNVVREAAVENEAPALVGVNGYGPPLQPVSSEVTVNVHGTTDPEAVAKHVTPMVRKELDRHHKRMVRQAHSDLVTEGP